MASKRGFMPALTLVCNFFLFLFELFFALFLLPFTFLNTEQVDCHGYALRLLSPAPAERKTLHVFRKNIDPVCAPELFVDIISERTALNEDFVSVVILDPRVPENLCTPAFILMLMQPLFKYTEGYAEFFSLIPRLRAARSSLTISS